MIKLNKEFSFILNQWGRASTDRLKLCRQPFRKFGSTARMSKDTGTRIPFNPEKSFRLTNQPDETWKLGEGLKPITELGRQWKAGEEHGWQTVNLDEMEKPLVYKLLTSAIIPRPIAFVSSLSSTGVPNLAPFSYFSMVSHNPPLISVSFTCSPDRPKDTRENVKATKEFTVNIISEPFIEAANATAVDAPAEISEWFVSGLTPEPSDIVEPPRVRESAVSFECELFHFIDISPAGVNNEEYTGSVALGRIRRVHIRKDVLAEDGLQVDASALRAVSRGGGNIYARVGEGFEMPRPSWKQKGEEIRSIIAEKSRGSP